MRLCLSLTAHYLILHLTGSASFTENPFNKCLKKKSFHLVVGDLGYGWNQTFVVSSCTVMSNEGFVPDAQFEFPEDAVQTGVTHWVYPRSSKNKNEKSRSV